MEGGLVRVFQKRLPTLRQLEITHSADVPHVEWPPRQYPAIPSLRLLQLHGLQLRLRPLASTIADCPDLKMIYVAHCKPGLKTLGQRDGSCCSMPYGYRNVVDMHLIFDAVLDKIDTLSFIFSRCTFDAASQQFHPLHKSCSCTWPG